MIMSPCKNCEWRKLGCHDRCDLYKEYRKQIDAVNETRRKILIVEGYTYGEVSRRVASIRKKHGNYKSKESKE